MRSYRQQALPRRAGALAVAASVLAAPAVAWAGNAPTITLNGPTGTVTANTATLAYTINRGGNQIAGLTCSLTGPITSTNCGTIQTVQGSTNATVTLSGLTNGTYTYAVTLTLTDGATTSSSKSFAVNVSALAVSLAVNDLGGDDDTPFPPYPTTLTVDGSADNLLKAHVANAPAAGVTYAWTIITPNTFGWLVNPIQTTASILMPASSIPDFGSSLDVNVMLTVTANDGSTPPVTVTGRMHYASSGLSVQAAATCQDPPLFPQASQSTISTTGSLTVSQHEIPPFGTRDTSCPISVDNTTTPTGTVTYTTETGQVLGATRPLDSLVIEGNTLGAGSHTITASYSFTWGEAFAYRVPMTVTVS